MKQIIAKIVLTCTLFLFISTLAYAQPPLPPGHGSDEDQSAPIGSGIGILLALGAAYGAKKVYDSKKKFRK